MLWILAGICFLILGYFVYGHYLMRLLAPDERKTPAFALRDDIDYIPMPLWKNQLIQLLNIAGVGPVIGVILGIKFGSICFFVIPIGCVIGGAVHDLIAGFMSLRYKGANLPALAQITFGRTYSRVFATFTILLLLLVVAVFINIPASLFSGLLPGDASSIFWGATILIFGYYIIATLFPIDKIIGRIYPIFGGLLLLGSLMMFAVLMYHGISSPELFTETKAFKAGKFTDMPIIPCLFVTIACGIISGFHATQSPIIARTIERERDIKPVFYGMMIAEGIIGMIWAAAGMAIYNLLPELMAQSPTKALISSTTHFLGNGLGTVTIISVIVLAITSGDTALRSMRLTLADLIKLPQSKISSRILITLPLIIIITGLLIWSNSDAKSFNYLWNYFAWGNQILAASTLMMVTTWLIQNKKSPICTIIPGIFMMFVVISYILWTSASHKGPAGFGLSIELSYLIAGVISTVLAIVSIRLGLKKPQNSDN